MTLREMIDKNKGMTTACVSVAVLALGAVIFAQTRSPSTVVDTSRAFFTIDDGKTWFADDASKLPPFTHQGKEAVACYVYQVGGSQKAVYLKKYPDEARRAIEKENASPNPNPLIAMRFANSVLVKRPGEAKWVSMSDIHSRDVQNPGPGAEPVDP